MRISATLSPYVTFVVSFLYSNMFEYALHRWVMHRRWRALSSPFETHTRFHHRIFHNETSYHVRRDEDRAHVLLFTWWQVALWVGSHAPALWTLQWASGLPLFYAGMIGLVVYYGLVEYLHWCMHSSVGRWIERSRIFRSLEAHHRFHHQYWRANFNLILPIGDILFGTFRPAVFLRHPSRRPQREPFTGARTRSVREAVGSIPRGHPILLPYHPEISPNGSNNPLSRRNR